MEDAFGDTRENVNHGVDSFLLWYVGELEHLQTVAEELAIKEEIHQVELSYNVYEAQNFTAKVTIDVRVVTLKEQIDKLAGIEFNEAELDSNHIRPFLRMVRSFYLPSLCFHASPLS